jgi:ABC-type amino acid transport substrate-binding protein
MRLFIFLLPMLLLAACNKDYSGHEPFNPSWQDVSQRGSGTITLVYVPSDGFSYVDENGHITGVTIELMRDFVHYIHSTHEVELSIHFKPIDRFSEFYNYVKLSTGGVFGVANVTITEQRKNELAFSPPYMTNIATLITHSDVPEIKHPDEIATAFNGLNALAFEGTLHQERLEAILAEYKPGADLLFARSNNEIIERTAAENNYFAYVDIYNYWRASGRGKPLQRHAAGDEASEQFGVIMPLESDWHSLMEEFFRMGDGYIHSPGYRDVMEEHLGKDLADLLLTRIPDSK